MALLNCNNATLGYGGTKVAQDLSFTVEAGDYLCIVGENGAGKTTLIKSLLGLIPIIDGDISFGDGLKQNEIGYLPQQTEVQKDFPASVWEVVLSGCLNRQGLRPYYNKDEKKLAKENLAKLGISDLTKACYRELSGGQQQRVLIARSMCATKKILLLDEPVAGLDPQASSELYQLIDDLNKENDITIIMISHDIATATRYASHILHLGNPTHFFGSRDEYLATEIGKIFSAFSGGEKNE